MLKLEYKKISDDTINVMKEAVLNNYDYYEKAVSEIQKLLPSEETHILNSANSCILTVAESLAEPILTVDMGGWNGFKKSCNILNKKYLEIKTINGLINIEELSYYFKENDIKSLYITALAAYNALQPVREIYELCILHDVVLVLDISGTVGYPEINNYCDIQIASTGSPKIINCENGGFINNITQKIKLNNHLLKTLKADKITCAAISNETKKSPQILEKTIKTNNYLKNKLNEKLEENSEYEIIHKDKTGINTIIKAPSNKKAKQLAYKIKEKIELTNNKSIITTGPNYNRIKTASVNIETKNMSINCLTNANMDKLADIIIKEIENMNQKGFI